MYQKHGAYYYVTKGNKWIRLSDNLAQAKANWIELEGDIPQTDTVAALIDRYLQEIAPKKAPRTYKDNLTEAKPRLPFPEKCVQVMFALCMCMIP